MKNNLCLLILIFLIQIVTNAQVTMVCSPDSLVDGDTLVVEMTVPHGGDFGIRSPEGVFFFVSFLGEKMAEGFFPDTSYHAFKEVRRLYLPTRTTKALPYVHGKTERIPIFSMPGYYEISLGENLETDDGTPVSECRVYFTGSATK